MILLYIPGSNSGLEQINDQPGAEELTTRDSSGTRRRHETTAAALDENKTSNPIVKTSLSAEDTTDGLDICINMGRFWQAHPAEGGGLKGAEEPADCLHKNRRCHIPDGRLQIRVALGERSERRAVDAMLHNFA